MSRGRPRLLVNGRFLTQPVTGVQRYGREIVRELGRRRELRVCVPTGGELPEDFPTSEAIGRSRGHLWEQWALPRRLRREADAVLLSPCNTGPLAVRRQILTLHDVSFLRHPEWFSRRFALAYRALVPRLARRCARLVTDSEFSRGEIAELLALPPERIAVVSPAVSSPFGTVGPAAEARRRPYLLAVASLEPRKNLLRLIQAFARLPAPGVELLVVGSSARIFARQDLRAAAEAQPALRLLGRVSDAELAQLYAGAQAFVFPSLYEGFGLPPLEAMACGCPVLVSRAGSLPEVCGDAACYVDPESVEDIARGLARILDDEALRESLRERGRQRSAKFSWERAAAELARVVDEVADAG